MALTPEDMQRIREEEEARAAVRNELNAPKPWPAPARGAAVFFGSTSLIGMPLVPMTGNAIGLVVWIIWVCVGITLVRHLKKLK